jgi:hypothetical protein
MVFIERQHPVVEHISGNQGVLPALELGEDNLGIGIDEGLLIMCLIHSLVIRL